MEGKLLKILEDLIYQKIIKAKQMPDFPIDVLIHLNYFWYTKVAHEIHKITLPTVFDPKVIDNLNNMTINIRDAKITFIKNKGNIYSADTETFFEMIYERI